MATTNTYTNVWISRPKIGIPAVPLGGPKCRLFVFPPAGAGPSSFLANGWIDGTLPTAIELMPVLYPGRSQRFMEKPLSDLGTLAVAVTEGLLPLLSDGTPYAFFGHSMGATVAWEVTRNLAARAGPGGLPLPRRIFVSARQPPGAGGFSKKLHQIADSRAFIEAVNAKYQTLDEVGAVSRPPPLSSSNL